MIVIQTDITTLGAFLLLFLVTVIAYQFVLLNDGVYLDGWYLDGWQRRKEWDVFKRFFSEVGMPYWYYYGRLMALLPFRTLAYKILSFLSLYISALAVYFLCQKSGFLTNSESMIIAVLMLCYPGQQIAAESTVSQYFICPCLFFVACLLGLHAESSAGLAQWLFRGSALMLFFISFNMNSLLAFYYGFILYIALLQIKEVGFQGFQLSQYVLYHMDYFLLPVLFWFLKEMITPRHGYYKDYNRVSININRLISGIYGLFAVGLLENIGQAIIYVIKKPLFVFMILSCSSLFLTVSWVIGPITGISEIKAFAIMLFGLVLLIFAGIPYILAGIRFGLRGWNTRNNVLLALPTALILYGSINLVIKPFYVYTILGCILAVFTIYLNYNYLGWIALWAKYRSMLQNLKNLPHAREFSIIGVRDQYPTPACNGSSPEHWTISITYMFAWIWGDVTHLGFSEDEWRKFFNKAVYADSAQQVGHVINKYTPEEIQKIIDNTTLDYALKGIDINGKQAVLVINKGNHNLGDIKLAIQYLKKRFFMPEEMSAFLSGITRLDFIPIESENLNGV